MTGPGGPGAEALEAARYQGRRLAEITIRLLGDLVGTATRRAS